MSNPNRLRAFLIGMLVVSGVLSVVGKKENSPPIGWVSFVCFVLAIFVYLQWRRALHNVRRGR